ncbi:MAG TPA: ABC transporter permease [Pseudonocardiaceae bacterium]|nr:ABC transporter permease [Pseudonocardiaceae bacterium]
MNDIIAAEWAKVRSLRSTYYLVGAALLAIIVGAALCFMITNSWDHSSVADRAHFPGADAGVVVLPFVLCVLAAFGGMAVTGEYGSGMMRTSLIAVPQRRALLLGKTAVVAVVAFVLGQVVSFGITLAELAIIGGRPAPINPWPHGLASAAMPAFASGLLVTMVGLVALGLGTVIRSTAGMLVSMITLLFVLPSIVVFLPSPWNLRIDAILPLHLATALANSTSTISSPLSPAVAGLLMIGYVVVAIGAGAFVISKRDA